MRQTTEQKLDMALDDLVERRAASGADGEDTRERGRRPDEAPLDRPLSVRRDGPYERREGKDGKGKGKRRLPPEDKALLNTQCFFTGDGDFAVRLYDTQVVTLRKRPEAIGADIVALASKLSADTAPADSHTSEKPAVAEGTAGDVTEKTAAAEGDAKPSDEKEKETADKLPADKKPADDAAADGKPEADEPVAKKPATESAVEAAKSANDGATPVGGMVAVLSTGKFKTIETRYIINEVLHSLSLRISEGSDGQWTVSGPSMPERPFEDDIEVTVSDPLLRASVVKDHLAKRIAEAKDREASRREPPVRRYGGRDEYGPVRGYPGYPHHPQYAYDPHQRPPPGWSPHHGAPPGWPPQYYGQPPPGWGAPPPHGHPHHAPVAQRGSQATSPSGATPVMASAAAAPPHGGSLPDSMFQ